MAQKPLREVTAKTLLQAHWQGDNAPGITCVAVTPDTSLDTLPQEHAWLTQGKIVVKVDELFGKRGKLGFVCIANTFEEAKAWLQEKRGSEATVGGRTGILNHFIIEPFIPHEDEYYLAFTTEREHDILYFSTEGGVEIEDQGDSIQEVRIVIDEEIDVSILPVPLQAMAKEMFETWKLLDMTYLEINPIAIADNKPYLLDCVCRVDTCAFHRQYSTWGYQELPHGFGSVPTPEETAIAALDAKTGSSLKFVLLHPEGRIWTMVAGGGASVIYADCIVDQADPTELANYGEWSGNPSTDEMEAYTGHILELMTRNPTKQALIIGGGIANFTDIKKTFAGVIKALKNYVDKLENISVFVRRAGPNDKQGLKALQQACDQLGIPCVTYGAELPMTEVVGMAISDLGIRDSAMNTLNPKSEVRSPIN